MRIDLGSLAFGFRLKKGTGTSNWSTAFGQGKEKKINERYDITKILRGIIYRSVPNEKVSIIAGKGGKQYCGDSTDSPIVLAGLFDKVFINDVLIEDGRFLLVLQKELDGVQKGRFKLRYAPTNIYRDGDYSYSNEDFFATARAQLGLADNACWVVSHITVDNQDTLKMTAIIVNKDGPVEYEDSQALKAAWKSLEPTLMDKDEFRIGQNIIFYGVPGCGKSHKIKHEYCDNELYMERVVFHPDYTYSDFVGQILPDSKGGHVTYPFKPGPFTRIMKKANDTRYQGHNVYLVIEELNRGNAPAIFGDIFQLLDRVNGESEYGINNPDIAKEVYGDENHLVKLPPNLFILATMNTADQNVFTLDTAFKRRWKMTNVISDITKCEKSGIKICDSNVTWGEFLNKINPRIVECAKQNLGSEDKRLGAFFISDEEIENTDYFSEKVLMYLWNDAFKYNHEMIFKDCNTLDELISNFKTSKFGVFNESIGFKTSSDEEDNGIA